MSKKARKKNKELRDKIKRARREANRAKYAALAGTEANRKSARKSQKSKLADKHRHPDGDCGNGACLRCSSSAANDPWQAPANSCIYGKRWNSPKWRRAA